MTDRPHLILITTDQHRGDCLGCDGHPVIETPYLDYLAACGARCSHAYTAVPSCVPARAGILTGMYQWNHGHLGMHGGIELEYPHTLPGELSRAGYQTQAVGKMHWSPQRKRMGFDNMVLDESSRREGQYIDDYQTWFEEHKQGAYGYRDHSVDWNSWMARPTHLPEWLHPTNWTTREGIRFLQRRDPSCPFFLWLSYARPHSPYEPPQVYYDRYIGADFPPPVVGDWAHIHDVPAERNDPNAWRAKRTPAETHRARAAYYGSITHIDAQIGLFLYELRRMGLMNDTFILFTSDHGDMVGDHHLWRKTYAYEGSARVPFLLQFPRGMGYPTNAVLEEPIELMDVMPTFLDMAGVDIPDTVDGRSVLPLARGENDGWRPFVHGEHSWCYSHEQEMQYVTDGREKFIWFPRTDTEQFFDLTCDPLEEHDLCGVASAAERVNLWRQRLVDTLVPRQDGLTDGKRLIRREGPIRVHGPNHARHVVRREA